MSNELLNENKILALILTYLINLCLKIVFSKAMKKSKSKINLFTE
jgi:hypothetical protein